MPFRHYHATQQKLALEHSILRVNQKFEEDNVGMGVPHWQKFEKLAEKIFAEFSPTSTVKWNDHILGEDTETNRQIDVSIRTSVDGLDALFVVQARNRTRPADVNSVGEFASVVRDVRADKGILVCRGGFTESAQRYASNIGIELLNLHDAESKDWHLEIEIPIPILWREDLPEVYIEASLHLDQATTFLTERNFPILSQDPERKSIIDIVGTIQSSWNSNQMEKSPGKGHVFSGPETLYALTSDKLWLPVTDFRVLYDISQRYWIGHFHPKKCRGILDYLNDSAFTVTHLPVGEIPIQRGDDWIEILDPAEVVVNLRGTIVVTESIEIRDGGGDYSSNFLRVD